MRFTRTFVALVLSGLLAVSSIGCGPETGSQTSLLQSEAPSASLPGTQSAFNSNRESELQEPATPATQTATQKKEGTKMETATFGGGCFWCVEAVFLELKGVKSVKSGYMGGKIDNPTYEQVCTGTTGHAEVIQIEFDPDVVSFDVLLQVFWKTHDPTTLNRQGNDRGTQYRSAVFYHNDEQKKKARDYKVKLNEVKAYPDPIVTEITQASKFYVAEDYHQNFYDRNPNQSYCRALIPPKLEKLRRVFGDKLKEK